MTLTHRAAGPVPRTGAREKERSKAKHAVPAMEELVVSTEGLAAKVRAPGPLDLDSGWATISFRPAGLGGCLLRGPGQGASLALGVADAGVGCDAGPAVRGGDAEGYRGGQGPGPGKPRTISLGGSYDRIPERC
jgi:hypothetical protein